MRDQQALTDMSSAVSPLAHDMSNYVSTIGMVAEASWEAVGLLYQRHLDARPGKDRNATANTYNGGVRVLVQLFTSMTD